MDFTLKQQIATEVKARMELKKLSYPLCAGQMDMSPATLNNMVNGLTDNTKWKSIGDSMWLKAKLWLGNRNKRWIIRDTYNFTHITGVCVDAQENARMLAVTGATDMGKTTTLEKYASKTGNVFYTLCTVTMGRKDLLRAIQKSIGIEEEGSIHFMMEAITNHLAKLNNPLLILDDVGKLSDVCMMLIQVFYDTLEGHLGIILSGMDLFRHYVTKMAAKDKKGFRELKRRIGYWLPLQPMSYDFIKTQAADFGINEAPALHYLKENFLGYGTLKEVLINYERLNDKLTAQGGTDRTQRELLVMVHTGEDTLKKVA